jgi:hypothetical protein
MNTELSDIVGTIKCIEVTEQEDGSALLTFDINEDFKEKYIKIFNLSEWSLEHFEGTLSQAIEKLVTKNQQGE